MSEPVALVDVIHEPGSPRMEIVVSCLACGAEISSHVFDASDPAGVRNAAKVGDAHVVAFLAHIAAEHASA